jgi:hypothetical protein
VNQKHQDHSSDNINLIAVPETNTVPLPSSAPNAIGRKVTIGQKWGDSCC